MRQRPPFLAQAPATLLLALAFGCSPGLAQCSRPIVVPAAPTGFSFQVAGDQVTGIYPEWLSAWGKRIGCSFEFPVVPRARADMMVLDTAQADLLIPASQNAQRDAKALFIHLYSLTPSLVVHASRSAEAPKDVRTLVERSSWRAAMVRRYSFGDEFDALVRKLDAAGRVDFVNDLETIERMLRAGRVEFTILPATLMYASLLDGKPMSNAAEFQYQELVGLPSVRSGAYLSTRTLTPRDAELLREGLARGARDGSLKRAFEAHYPAEALRLDRFLR